MVAKVSLKEIIDDILLLVRNNNISESEDLSRSQIASWVNAYRKHLWKQRKDEIRARKEKYGIDWEDIVDNEVFVIKETGPHKLVKVESGDTDRNLYTKRTEDTFEDIADNAPTSILAVHDEAGENIQYMDHIRRHYQYFRKHTFGEMTSFYKDDKHIYVQGLQDMGLLEYVYVLAVYEMENDNDYEDEVDDPDEDDIKVPAWMVPPIKKLILNNELAFMLNRPSDDSNNATLASVKPHGPQDDEE